MCDHLPQRLQTKRQKRNACYEVGCLLQLIVITPPRALHAAFASAGVMCSSFYEEPCSMITLGLHKLGMEHPASQ